MVGEACLPSNAYYPRTPDYTLYSGVNVCWSEHSDSSFVYGFMSLDYGLGTMNATTIYTFSSSILLLVPRGGVGWGCASCLLHCLCTFTCIYTNKEDHQQRNSLELSAGTTSGGEGLKQVLLHRNLAFNSDAVQNYKYVFGPRRVLYLISETSQ